MGDSQWSQINNSIKAAIQFHPNLRKYYICLPRNLNDGRKNTKSGKPAKTERMRWNDHVVDWEAIAKENGLDLEFVLWDASEIENKLLKLKNMEGLIDYWFNDDIISFTKLETLFEKSRRNLGARYSSEANITLPIEKSLGGLVQNDDWREQISHLIKSFYKEFHQITDLDEAGLSENAQQYIREVRENLNLVKKHIQQVERDENYILESSKVFDKDVKRVIQNLEDAIHELSKLNDNQSEVSGSAKDVHYKLVFTQEVFGEMERFFHSIAFKAAQKRVLLITGRAGCGKSHLLCDFSKVQLESGVPVVHLLGQRYSGGDPKCFIGQELGISNASNVLSILEVLGSVYEKRVLIVIDALNEGRSNKEWQDFLYGFLEEVNKFSHLSLLISCRDTYLDIVFDSEMKDLLPTLVHLGFTGNQSEAVRRYLTKYSIEMPDTPLLGSEFTNPLFLRTVCVGMNVANEHNFSDNIFSLSELLNFYRTNLEGNVKRRLGIHSKDLIHRAINEFINKIYPEHLYGISYFEARNVFQEFYKNDGDNGLLEVLIDEGLLSCEATIEGDDNVRFTFERFSDFYIAENILNQYSSIESLKKAFLPENELGKLLIEYAGMNGILEILCIRIPERFKVEIFDLINWKKTDIKKHSIREHVLTSVFADGLPLRLPGSFSDKTVELLNELKNTSHDFNGKWLDILLHLSLSIEHPWNINFLDKFLKKLKLNERDYLWSTYVALNDYSEDSDYPEGSVRNIINWAIETDFNKVSNQRMELLAKTLLWFSTTPNIDTRVRVEKALIHVLLHSDDDLLYLIQNYSKINDVYLLNSLYAVVYAVALTKGDKTMLKRLAKCIPWKALIGNEGSNIILRDYLTGIHAYLKYKQIDCFEGEALFPIHKQRLLPKLTFPSKQDNAEFDNSRIELSAGSDFGDFGKYSMSVIDNWSCTRIDEFKHAQTNGELAKAIFERLNSTDKQIFLKLQKLKLEKNKISTDDQYTTVDTALPEILRLAMLNEKGNEQILKIENDEKSLLKKVPLKLSEDIKWAVENWNSKTIKRFDMEQSQRWVVNYAHKLGWKEELFAQFERTYCEYPRIPGFRNIERIGKKYEWIAFYTLLARISEQYYWNGIFDEDGKEFYGIWQCHLRKNDITAPLSINEGHNISGQKNIWKSIEYANMPKLERENQVDWLNDEETIPDFRENILYSDSSNGKWLALADQYSKDDEPSNPEIKRPKTNIWYRINSCVISSDKSQEILKLINSTKPSLMSPGVIEISRNRLQEFYQEYPWRKLVSNSQEELQFREIPKLQKFTYSSLLHSYEWEFDELDYRSDSYMPSERLINDLGLMSDNMGGWYIDENLIFIDPSIMYGEKSKAFVNEEVLKDWLIANNLTLIWLIGGEKRIYDMGHNLNGFQKGETCEFGAMYYLGSNMNILGDNWQVK